MEKKIGKIKKSTGFISWTLILLTVFGLGYFSNEITRPSIEKIEGISNKEGQIGDVDFSLFWDAWYLVKTKYVD